MSSIYDIAGTSAKSFSFGNITFLQGDEAPQSYVGENGCFYFQTNGTIWAKVNNNWQIIASTNN